MPTHDLTPFPATGRIFTRTVKAGLGDAAPGGRVRLDAIARWLQDVAYADLVEAGVDHCAVWVVRRSRMRVLRFPRMGTDVTLRTACSGLGRMWAERRTTVMAGGETLVDAVSLWVHLDPGSGRPLPITDAELEIYAQSTNGRQVKGRLRHPPPPPDLKGGSWWFRAADMDVAGHVNNAVAWTVLEEELLAGPEPEALDVEAEYRAPAQPGPHEIVRENGCMWVRAPGGEVHISILQVR